VAAAPVSPASLAELIALIESGTISGKIAKGVLPDMVATGRGARELVEEQGLLQVTDEQAIVAVIDEVIAAHPDELKRYRGGKTKLFGFFVGQVMKRSQGKASPSLVNKILKERL
jgi:aspartyl-tRNA(Asn)/glutamyl-tRNA(Gln) amidotransferase subunit B